MKRLMLLMLIFCSQAVLAGAKDDFINAVVKQCGKSKDEASKLATPGRTGNVMKLRICNSATVTVGDCTLSCSDSSSKIGG